VPIAKPSMADRASSMIALDEVSARRRSMVIQ
jgi:hypothetical protein